MPVTERGATALARLRGPIVPLNLAFADDGSPDHAAIARYVDYLAGSCEGKPPVLLLTYGSSEFACLSREDIYAVTQTVAEANAGRALCVAATGFWTPAETSSFLEHADAVGCDAVKVQISPQLPYDRSTLVGYFVRTPAPAPAPCDLRAGGDRMRWSRLRRTSRCCCGRSTPPSSRWRWRWSLPPGRASSA